MSRVGNCHGLPIEMQVEKTHGRVGQKIVTHMPFRAACREYAHKQVAAQRCAIFQALGPSRADLVENPYCDDDAAV